MNTISSTPAAAASKAVWPQALRTPRGAFASGWIARIRADADAVCRAALREEASLLRELVGGCAALAGRALEEGSAPARAAAGGGER